MNLMIATLRRLTLASLLSWPGMILADAADWRDVSVQNEGRIIYQDYCAQCHGADLEGEANWRQRKPDGRLPAPPHDASGHTWHHPDDVLFAITKFGTAALVGNGYESDMIGFGDLLSDAEIRAVLAYIKSTWPDDVISAHDRINADAAAQSN